MPFKSESKWVSRAGAAGHRAEILTVQHLRRQRPCQRPLHVGIASREVVRQHLDTAYVKYSTCCGTNSIYQHIDLYKTQSSWSSRHRILVTARSVRVQLDFGRMWIITGNLNSGADGKFKPYAKLSQSLTRVPTDQVDARPPVSSHWIRPGRHYRLGRMGGYTPPNSKGVTRARPNDFTVKAAATPKDGAWILKAGGEDWDPVRSWDRVYLESKLFLRLGRKL